MKGFVVSLQGCCEASMVLLSVSVDDCLELVVSRPKRGIVRNIH